MFHHFPPLPIPHLKIQHRAGEHQGHNVADNDGGVADQEAINQPEEDTRCEDGEQSQRQVACGLGFPGFDDLGEVSKGGQESCNKADQLGQIHLIMAFGAKLLYFPDFVIWAAPG